MVTVWVGLTSLQSLHCTGVVQNDISASASLQHFTIYKFIYSFTNIHLYLPVL